MESIITLLFLFSFFTGIISIYIALIFYKIYKNMLILQFAFFIFSLILMIAPFTMKNYFLLNHAETGALFQRISLLVQTIGIFLYFLFFPFFIYKIFTVPLPGYFKIVYYVLPVLILITGVLFAFDLFTPVSKYLLNYGLHIFTLHLLLIGLLSFKRVGSAFLKKSIVTFLVLSAAFLPLFILDTLFFDKKQIALPVYFCIINLLSINFTLFYFNKKPFMVKNRLTAHFKTAFEITGREEEIILLLLDGSSYAQAGKKLFISPKTVDNHVQSIYKKLNINNRYQLINVIRTNQR